MRLNSFDFLTDQITRGLLVIGSGQLIRLAFGLVSSVLIARALGNDNFGVYGVLAAFTAIVSTLTDLGLTTTIAQKIGAIWPDELASIQARGRIYFWSKVSAGTIMVITGLFLARPLAQLILNSTAASQVRLLRLAWLGVGAIVLSGSMDALLRATRQFKQINLVQLSNAGLTALLALLLSLAGHLTLANAIVILGIGTSIISFVIGRRLLPAPLDLKLPEPATWRQGQLDMLRFSRWIAISNVSLVLSRQVDVILLNRWDSSAAAGLYFLALSLATKVEIINHSQHTVLVPMAAKLRDGQAIRNYLQQRLQRNGIITLLLLPAWLLVDPLVRFLYGPEFLAAIPLFRWLFLVVLFDFVTLPITLLFLPLNRPNLLTFADLVQTALFLGGAVWLIPLHGATGAIIARGAAKLVGFLAASALLYMIRRQATAAE